MVGFDCKGFCTAYDHIPFARAVKPNRNTKGCSRCEKWIYGLPNGTIWCVCCGTRLRRSPRQKGKIRKAMRVYIE